MVVRLFAGLARLASDREKGGRESFPNFIGHQSCQCLLSWDMYSTERILIKRDCFGYNFIKSS